MKKLLVVVLALCMALSCASFASADEAPVKLTWMMSEFDVTPSMELPIIAELCKRVNVEIEFITVATDDFQQKFNLMLTNPGDMPDLISTNKDSALLYGPDLFVELNSIADQLPNYFGLLDSKKIRDRVELDGKIYGATRIEETRGTWYGLFMRKDVLEANGIAIPNTIEEYTEVFAKLKELYPDSYAMTGRWGLDNNVGYWTRWFNTGSGVFYNAQEDTYQYGPVSDEYKAMVEFLRMCWEKGYLDPEIISQTDDQFYAKLYNGGAFGMSDYFGAETNCNSRCVPENPDYYMCALPIPVVNGVRGYTYVNDYATTAEMLVITNNCKNVEAATKLVDYLYSDEGSMLMAWGLEGLTYEVKEDGSYTRTALIINGNNPNGTKTEREMGMRIGGLAKYFRAGVDEAGWSGAQLEGKTLYAPWGAPVEPVLTFSEEQSQKRSDIKTDLDTYRAATVSAFITGEMSMDEWDTFVATLESMGCNDLVDLYNEVYGK